MTTKRFEPGSLRRRIVERSREALDSGALEPIATRSEVVEDAGVRFLVRVLERLDRKLASDARQERDASNPFLPYDEALFVAEVSDTHVALLNKFNVLDHHVLLVTREFEEQESLLSPEDFDAIWACLPELEALFFYNAGTDAGASQRHKHLQLVPLPLGDGPDPVPMSPLVERARYPNHVGVVDELPFVHGLARLGGASAGKARERYLELLAAVGRGPDPGAYNLLLTREWMLLVPRRGEKCGSISVNALGFAGALLVRNDEELDTLREIRPMCLLESVSISRRHGRSHR